MSLAPGSVWVVPYDGTSRIAGTGIGAVDLARAVKERLLVHPLGRAGDDGAATRLFSVLADVSRSSRVWCARLRALCNIAPPRWVIGGEHIVTFPILEYWKAQHPNLRVVVFDAHHDAYAYPLLTHFSVFHFVARELGLPVLVLGARHELQKGDAQVETFSAARWLNEGSDAAARAVVDFVGDHPFYVSVDVDVLDPEILPGVGDRVAGGLSVDALAGVLRSTLTKGPVGVDTVEYNALRDTHGTGVRVLAPVLDEVIAWML